MVNNPLLCALLSTGYRGQWAGISQLPVLLCVSEEGTSVYDQHDLPMLVAML